MTLKTKNLRKSKRRACAPSTVVRMTADDLYGLAAALEAEDLLGADERPLSADDIFPILEALQERGIDLSPNESTHP